ncbi:MAG: hypothetical protein HWN65_14195 [Candidatus Helarchaeota archaeon]|nr:hypothetical protein [Candidatus Helarchaeota archaeon]
MEELKLTMIKKDREIERLKQKIKEQEEKQKRDQVRLKKEIKELGNRVKELVKEKKGLSIRKEQAVHEKEKIIKQIEDLQEQNKKLDEDLSQVGTVRAEIRGLKLKADNQLTKISDLEEVSKRRDGVIADLRGSESQLREEIRVKNAEIAHVESEVNAAKSDKVTAIKSIDAAEANITKIKTKINTLKSTITNQNSEITHLYSEIEKFNLEKDRLSQTLAEKDGEITKLSTEVGDVIADSKLLEEKVVQYQKSLEDAKAGIIPQILPNLIKGEAQAIERIIEIIPNVKKDALICVPKLDILPDVIKLGNLNPSARLRIMTSIDFSNPSHKAIFQQFSKSNILIRNSEEKKMWAIDRDHEELLIAPQDYSGTPTGLIVKGSFQIEILGNILLDIWGNCRRNVHISEFQ